MHVSLPQEPVDTHAATVEQWALDFIRTTSLPHKLSPPPPPKAWSTDTNFPVPNSPGRPPELQVTVERMRTPRASALAERRPRAKLLHTFLHHELQAAELMCWALLRFPDTPLSFKRGLLSICLDELRHMQGYARLLQEAGYEPGSFPVKDSFWDRVPRCETPGQFVALVGMGMEGANLEHAPAFAERMDKVGCTSAAEFLRQVALEEQGHVQFGVTWFAHFVGPVTFDNWVKQLPPPWSPLLMRGPRLEVEARRAAGMPSHFIQELEAWHQRERGS